MNDTNNELQSFFNNGTLYFLITYFMLLFCKIYSYSDTTGAEILKVPVGARQIGIGTAFTSVADDSTALYYNSAGLNNTRNFEFNTSYIQNIEDIYYIFMATTKRLNNNSVIGFSLYALDAGTIEFYIDDFTYKTVKVEQDYVLTVGFGKQFSENILFGINIKRIQSTLIEEYTASAYASDIGFLLKNIFNRTGLQFGFSIQNYGTKLKFIEIGDSLPFLYRGGISYLLKLKKSTSFLFAADGVQFLNKKRPEIYTGFEYIYNSIIMLRAGSKSYLEKNSVYFGIGFMLNNIQFDYSEQFFQKDSYDNKYWISIIFK